MSVDPILLVVRRGARRRFAALKKKTAHLDVEVIWDRRERKRRQSIGVMQREQRASDRRAQCSVSWQLADFAVSVPSESD